MPKGLSEEGDTIGYSNVLVGLLELAMRESIHFGDWLSQSRLQALGPLNRENGA